MLPTICNVQQDGQHLDHHPSIFRTEAIMKKASLTVLCSLSMLAGAAYAQTDSGVRMSTDPATAADVEQRAQALQQQQDQMPMHESMPMKKSHGHRKGMHMHKHGAKAGGAGAAAPASGASE
jgi:hypothetical protein